MLLAASRKLFVVAVGDQLVGKIRNVSGTDESNQHQESGPGDFVLECGPAADDLRKSENRSSEENSEEPTESLEEPKYPAAHNIGFSFNRLDLVDGRWISAVAVSRSGKFIAVANNFKHLFVYQFTDNDGTPPSLLRTWFLAKRTMAMCFAKDESSVIVADKLGDVFLYEIAGGATGKERGTLILGHISVITDVCLSSGDQFILTSDRDEKVRVSHFPLADDIQAFCLGNTSFVTKILIPWPNHNGVITASGDGSLRAFNYETGKQIGLQHPETPSDVEGLSETGFPLSMDYNAQDNLLLVAFHGSAFISGYQLIHGETITFQPSGSVKLNFPVRQLTFSGESVLVLFNSTSHPFESFNNAKQLFAGSKSQPESSIENLIRSRVDVIVKNSHGESLLFDPFAELHNIPENAALDSSIPAQKKPRLDEALA